MILMIDNYDSFTYNLVQMLQVMGQKIHVCRNDHIDLPGIESLNPSSIVISPGPGTPDQAGIAKTAIRCFGAEIPVFGVCLGHQSIAEAFGGRVIQSKRTMHGKMSSIFHDQQSIYRNLPNPFQATRYHSLIVEERFLPECLKVTAWTDRGEIMGIRHREYAIEGVQFHPESILTKEGDQLLRNFININCQ